MRVMPLGTSSGAPTSERNVSALAVDLGERWVLVDCGEGTQHQLLRSPLRAARLAGVLVTHLHGDHVLGLPGLLASLSMGLRSEPLPIIGPVGIAAWLDHMRSTPLLSLDFELDIVELAETDAARSTAFDPLTMAPPAPTPSPRPLPIEFGGIHVATLPLRHRVTSFGYRLTERQPQPRVDVARLAALGLRPGPAIGRLKAGHPVTHDGRIVRPDDVLAPAGAPRSIAVMGDTVPCWNAVALAQGSALLVHEATYADEHLDLGARWTHSTARQAAQIAAAAKAERLLLTHFSSRYTDVDRLVDEARQEWPPTRAAVEGAWFDLDDWLA